MASLPWLARLPRESTRALEYLCRRDGQFMWPCPCAMAAARIREKNSSLSGPAFYPNDLAEGERQLRPSPARRSHGPNQISRRLFSGCWVSPVAQHPQEGIFRRAHNRRVRRSCSNNGCGRFLRFGRFGQRPLGRFQDTVGKFNDVAFMDQPRANHSPPQSVQARFARGRSHGAFNRRLAGGRRRVAAAAGKCGWLRATSESITFRRVYLGWALMKSTMRLIPSETGVASKSRKRGRATHTWVTVRAPQKNCSPCPANCWLSIVATCKGKRRWSSHVMRTARCNPGERPLRRRPR